MQQVIRAFPVLPGKEKKLHALAEEMQTTRAQEAMEFYGRFGVSRESWHLQHTPSGPWLIGVTQLAERPVAEVAKEYAASQQPFDRWFKDQVKELSGIDPDVTPLGPTTTCIFDTAMLQVATT